MAQTVRTVLIVVALAAAAAAGKVAIETRGGSALFQTEEFNAPEAILAGARPNQVTCRQVETQIDEGYGVSGRELRWVCRKTR